MTTVDLGIELGLATTKDVAAMLLSRGAAPPGAMIWLNPQEKTFQLALFGGSTPRQLRYMARILQDAAYRQQRQPPNDD